MADRWVRVPNSGAGTAADPNRPTYADRTVSWIGARLSSPPLWVVRMYADSATLDSIAAEGDTTALTPEGALTLLNDATNAALEGTGRPWPDTDELHRRFAAEGP
jgi:hypothetical protein